MDQLCKFCVPCVGIIAELRNVFLCHACDGLRFLFKLFSARILRVHGAWLFCSACNCLLQFFRMLFCASHGLRGDLFCCLVFRKGASLTLSAVLRSSTIIVAPSSAVMQGACGLCLFDGGKGGWWACERSGTSRHSA